MQRARDVRVRCELSRKEQFQKSHIIQLSPLSNSLSIEITIFYSSLIILQKFLEIFTYSVEDCKFLKLEKFLTKVMKLV